MQAQRHPGEGNVLWQASPAEATQTRLAHYQRWLASERGVDRPDYADLWSWSVADIEGFWQTIWDYFDVQADGSREPVLASRAMPGAEWYPHARLNYAEHVFRHATTERPALIVRAEDAPVREVSWAELRRDTAAFAARLREWGIGEGDRVALKERLEAALGAFECQPLADRLVREGVPCAPIVDVAQALADPHTRHRGMVVEIDGYRGVASPIKLSRTPASYRRAPPKRQG